MSSSPTTVTVKFKVGHAAEFGESMKVVGAADGLGAWDVNEAPNLEWGKGDVWSLDLELPPGDYEFKCVKVRVDGSYLWEPGDNREIEVPEETPSGSVFEVDCLFWDTQSTSSIVSLDEEEFDAIPIEKTGGTSTTGRTAEKSPEKFNKQNGGTKPPFGAKDASVGTIKAQDVAPLNKTGEFNAKNETKDKDAKSDTRKGVASFKTRDGTASNQGPDKAIKNETRSIVLSKETRDLIASIRSRSLVASKKTQEIVPSNETRGKEQVTKAASVGSNGPSVDDSSNPVNSNSAAEESVEQPSAVAREEVNQVEKESDSSVGIPKAALPAEAASGGTNVTNDGNGESKKDDESHPDNEEADQSTSLRQSAPSTSQNDVQDQQNNPSSKENEPNSDVGVGGMLAIVGGLVAVPVVAWSEITLKTTGCGLPPGPAGLLGGLEGISYLVVVAVVGWSLTSRISSGSGLPDGPGGLLRLVESLSYTTILAGFIVLGLQVVDYGYIPSALPDEKCYGKPEPVEPPKEVSKPSFPSFSLQDNFPSLTKIIVD